MKAVALTPILDDRNNQTIAKGDTFEMDDYKVQSLIDIKAAKLEAESKTEHKKAEAKE